MLLSCGLEKTLESPLDCKEIQPVHPKGNQSWMFIFGRIDAEAETPVLCLATWCEGLTHLKRPWCWERLKVGGEGEDRRWDGWMESQTKWMWVWVSPGVGDEQGSLPWCSPWGHRIGHNWRTELNWQLTYISMLASGCRFHTCRQWFHTSVH